MMTKEEIADCFEVKCAHPGCINTHKLYGFSGPYALSTISGLTRVQAIKSKHWTAVDDQDFSKGLLCPEHKQ